MAKAKSTTLNVDVQPVDNQISNDVPGSIRITSQLSDNNIIVTDRKSLDCVIDDMQSENFHGGQHLKVFKLGQKINGMLDGVTFTGSAPYYRIPSMVITKRGRIVIVSDYRASGADQVAIEVAYGISENGGLNMQYGKAISRDTTTTGWSNNLSRVMDSTFLYDKDNGTDGTLYVLAGKWITGTENWQNHQWVSGANTSKGKWTSATMAKFNPDTNTWTQAPLNLVNNDGATNNLHGLLGGVGQGIKMSNGEFIMPVQYTEAAAGYKTGVIVSTNPDNGWTFIRNELEMSEWSIFELRPGTLIGMGRQGNNTKAYKSTDWGRTWSVFSPFNDKIVQTNGDCEGSYISFTTLAGKTIVIGSRPQNNDMADLGINDQYGRNQITVYYLSEAASKAIPVDVVQYLPGVDNNGERNSTVYGGYSSLTYYQGIDGEKLMIAYEDRGGITIQDISYLIPHLNQLADKYDPVDDGLADRVSEVAVPVVKEGVAKEVNYIGETTLGPVYITDVLADLSSVDAEGRLLDARTGQKYPKANSGANKPTMGTGKESGLIIFDSASATNVNDRPAIDIPDENGVFGLTLPFTACFEFSYTTNGDSSAGWPSVFRGYKDVSNVEAGNQLFGVNIQRTPASDGGMVFNPFAISTSGQTNIFRMKDSEGCKHGDVIHYAIIIKEDGKQLHYVNGIEVNNSTAYNAATGTATSNLPAPGVGFVPNNQPTAIKRIGIGNDVASRKQYKIAFGNLKFYNKKLTDEEIETLYSRRKEYLQALRTDYKSGFVGAINELKDEVNSVSTSASMLNESNVFENVANLDFLKNGNAQFRNNSSELSGTSWSHYIGAGEFTWTDGNGNTITTSDDGLVMNSRGDSASMSQPNCPTLDLNSALPGFSSLTGFSVEIEFKIGTLTSCGEFPGVFNINKGSEAWTNNRVLGLLVRNSNGASNTNYSLGLHTLNNATIPTTQTDGDKTGGPIATTVSSSQFIKVLFTLDASTTSNNVKMYVNGALSETRSSNLGSDLSNISTINFGSFRSASGVSVFTVKNVKLFNKVLTASDLEQRNNENPEFFVDLTRKLNKLTSDVIESTEKVNESTTKVDEMSNKVDFITPLVEQLMVVGSKIPETENLIVNLNSTVFKNGLAKTGYAYDFESTLPNVRDLKFYVDDTTPQSTFGNNKNTGYANSDLSYNNELGYLYVGKDKRKTVIDLSELGLLNGSEGFTIEVEIEKVDGVEAAWAGCFLVSNAADLPSLGSGSCYNWSEGSNKCFTIEPKGTGSTSSFGIYAANMATDNNLCPTFKENVGAGDRIKAVFTLDSNNDFKAYSDYSSTHANSTTQVNGMEGVRYIAFNHGYKDGSGAKCCNIKIHKLRVWKGVALSGSQVAELANH